MSLRHTGRLLAVAAALATWATSPSPASAATRLVHRPVVTYHVTPAGRTYFEIVVRMDQALPRSPSGSILAGARVNGYGPTLDFSQQQESYGGFVRFGRAATRYCYSQSTFNIIDPPPSALRHPRPGDTVRVAVVVKGQHQISRRAHLIRSSSLPGAARAIGCVRAPAFVG